jgi:hypothetical protein
MQYYQNEDGVHLGDPLGDDFTLCRDACEGDEREFGKMETVPTQKITCTRCLEIIRCCYEVGRIQLLPRPPIQSPSGAAGVRE